MAAETTSMERSNEETSAGASFHDRLEGHGGAEPSVMCVGSKPGSSRQLQGVHVEKPRPENKKGVRKA